MSGQENVMENRRKIKALGIAPYEGMRALMESLADHHDNIDLDVYVGDLKNGTEIVRQNVDNDYDVIISRGGTAEMIEKMTSLPVIEITISVYDVLQAIELAKNFSGKYAIIGFPSITGPARMLCDLLHYQTDILTLHDASEAKEAVNHARSLGCGIILCDTVTEVEARRMDMNTVLIASGSEAIEDALKRAEEVSRNYLNVLEDRTFYRKLLEEQEIETVVFDQKDQLYFSTLRGPDSDRMLRLLTDELSTSRHRKKRKLFKTIDDRMYSVSSLVFSLSGEEYVAFSLSAMDMPIQAGRYGIKYYNRKETEDIFFNDLFSMSQTSKNIQATIDQINQSQLPVMILGEPGTGRAQCANLIYRRSRLSDNPLTSIDCSLLSEKGWHFLTNHYNSPLNESGSTIHFRRLTALGTDKMKQLMTILYDSSICSRNRIIFSASFRVGEPMLPELREYLNTFSCITIQLPSLREHIDELPSIAGFYLSSINTGLSRKIVGFDKDAMALMEAYSWPENYTQLRRVISEAALSAESSFISAENIRSILNWERRLLYSSSAEFPIKVTSGSSGDANSSENDGTDIEKAESGSNGPAFSRTAKSAPGRNVLSLSLDLPLDQMNLQIIQAVLSRCGGNQSLAARSLGIGRTTLWRMLKEAED